MNLRIIAIAPFAALALMLASCKNAEESGAASVDPGFMSQDLGIGIYLWQSANDARQVSTGKLSGADIWVKTAEEMIGRNPYDEKDSDDLVVAVYRESSEAINDNEPPVINPIYEFKAYLSAADISEVMLFGTKAASLTPQSVKDWLGDADLESNSADGNTHLAYRYALPDNPHYMLDVVFSHKITGACFALDMSLSKQ